MRSASAGVRGEGFLRVDVRPGFGGRSNHLLPLIQPTRAYSDEIRFFDAKHLSIIRVGPLGSRPFGCACPAGFIRVGDRYHFHLFEGGPDSVDPVAIVAVAGIAYHSDPVFLSGSR